MSNEQRIAIDIWSDYVCPFCYLELPLIDRLKEEFGAQLNITWRAFELRPDPVPTLDPNGEYLHDIWGRSVYPMAEQRRMTLRSACRRCSRAAARRSKQSLMRAVPGNSTQCITRYSARSSKMGKISAILASWPT